MYPDSLFLGLTLYDIFILVGVVAAFLLADRMTVKSGFSVTLQKNRHCLRVVLRHCRLRFRGALSGLL